MDTNSGIFIPGSLKPLPENLQTIYQNLTSKCLKLDEAENSPTSDKSCASVKVPVGKNRREMFVQFKPRKSLMRVELHISTKDLQDPKGICKPITYYQRWSYFNININDNDIDYYFSLIKQSYKEVRNKIKR